MRDATPEAFADALVPALAADRAPDARRAVSALGLERVAHQLMDIYDQARVGHAHAPKFATA